ncbi:type IV conjugative transfer system coupling protein TraD [Salinisphaera hydrothermalis]|uniref:TraG-like protein n=1 Tax=Salinisphaera hydrothermalis (strain C41B8) TaxID=1304275 RepID=A0A084IJ12_SALHC|nr:type IV conjugative transfer system coupling protein TraD [Salinisphaera hydrothermalis]KEZ76696.1 traG-like protein [Salinisphaera hydrothermalis C41B8]
MASTHPIETLLRPAVEVYTALACAGCGVVCLAAPWMIALTPSVGYGLAAAFAGFGLYRLGQAWQVVRYRRGMKRLPRFALASSQIPVSQRYLWLGRGFRWQVQHTRRLHEAQQPEAHAFLMPSRAYRAARALEAPFERWHLTWLVDVLRADTVLNPVRPLPPVGGDPALHAVEPGETDIYLPLAERVAHTLVQGTTRVGKTRLAEVLVAQDIRRQVGGGEVVIVIDPKGDADLMKRMYVEAKRAGRLDAFRVFHLGYPEVSARYNAVGRFGRISEVATRLSGQLSGEGNSAAFREFAWRFVNIVARARHALGYRPTYQQILADVVAIDELMIEYAGYCLPRLDDTAWAQITAIENGLNEKKVPRNMQGRAYRVVAIEFYLQGNRAADPVLAGLRSAVRYDKTYFDKIVASLLPLLEKLTTGATAELLSPNYDDIDDDRDIFDWRQVIRQKGIVYVGLDALSDFEVAQAVGNSMFADLVSVAGDIYKRGVDDGLPGADPGTKPVINLHCDEFNELIGDEFIPLMNKGGGAGVQVTAYTQTLSDIEARLGNTAKARQVIGNFNNVIMLRVREEMTAQLLTRQLPEVMVSQRMLVSMAGDNSDVDTDTDFSSSGGDRVTTTPKPMLTAADIIKLPKGQAFALIEGGRLYKIRMPLPKAADAAELPADLTDMAERMRERYQTADHWWDDVAPPPVTVEPTAQASTPNSWAGDTIHDTAVSAELGEDDD